MSNSNQLFTTAPQIDIIAGDTKTLPFEVAQADGGVVDLTMNGTVIAFYLTPYEEPNTNILTLTLADGDITIDANNSACFDVKLSATDTANLDSDYQYQIEITTPLSDTFRPIQGLLHFWPKNA